MAADDDRPPPSLDRVSAFSDGVFAIAITLLILPLTDAQVRDSQSSRTCWRCSTSSSHSR